MDRIVILPGTATARIVIADPRVVALYDVSDDRTYPVVETGGLRHADVSIRAGFGVVLGLIETPVAKLIARVDAG